MGGEKQKMPCKYFSGLHYWVITLQVRQGFYLFTPVGTIIKVKDQVDAG